MKGPLHYISSGCHPTYYNRSAHPLFVALKKNKNPKKIRKITKWKKIVTRERKADSEIFFLFWEPWLAKQQYCILKYLYRSALQLEAFCLFLWPYHFGKFMLNYCTLTTNHFFILYLLWPFGRCGLVIIIFYIL